MNSARRKTNYKRRARYSAPKLTILTPQQVMDMAEERHLEHAAGAIRRYAAKSVADAGRALFNHRMTMTRKVREARDNLDRLTIAGAIAWRTARACHRRDIPLVVYLGDDQINGSELTLTVEGVSTNPNVEPLSHAEIALLDAILRASAAEEGVVLGAMDQSRPGVYAVPDA